MTHTPGPWKADPSFLTAINAGKKHIAMVNFYKCADPEIRIDEEEHAANVALIAAAPDLLAAVRALAACIDPNEGISSQEIAALDLAEAAIIKATGVK